MSTGFLLGTLFLQVVLLRLRSRDLTVWRCLQASIAIVDLVIIASVLQGLSIQGRITPALWRWQEWGNLLITGFVLATRVVFLLVVHPTQLGDSRAKWD